MGNMRMNNNLVKRLLTNVVRHVHPDRLAHHPDPVFKNTNSSSLQDLNGLVSQVIALQTPRPNIRGVVDTVLRVPTKLGFYCLATGSSSTSTGVPQLLEHTLHVYPTTELVDELYMHPPVRNAAQGSDAETETDAWKLQARAPESPPAQPAPRPTGSFADRDEEIYRTLSTPRHMYPETTTSKSSPRRPTPRWIPTVFPADLLRDLQALTSNSESENNDPPKGTSSSRLRSLVESQSVSLNGVVTRLQTLTRTTLTHSMLQLLNALVAMDTGDVHSAEERWIEEYRDSVAVMLQKQLKEMYAVLGNRIGPESAGGRDFQPTRVPPLAARWRRGREFGREFADMFRMQVERNEKQRRGG